jgi:hypothetical protein
VKGARVASLVALAALSASCGAPAGHASSSGSRTHKGPTVMASTQPGIDCSVVSAAAVDSALGVSVTGPVVRIDGARSTCTYSSGRFRELVAVTFDTSATPASLATEAARIASVGATTSTLAGIGSMAVAASVGSGPDQTNTVAAIAGHLQVSVSAPAPIAKIEALVAAALREA